MCCASRPGTTPKRVDGALSESPVPRNRPDWQSNQVLRGLSPRLLGITGVVTYSIYLQLTPCRDLSFLCSFPHIRSLVLDHNSLESLSTFPADSLSQLSTLWLNFNLISCRCLTHVAMHFSPPSSAPPQRYSLDHLLLWVVSSSSFLLLLLCYCWAGMFTCPAWMSSWMCWKNFLL